MKVACEDTQVQLLCMETSVQMGAKSGSPRLVSSVF